MYSVSFVLFVPFTFTLHYSTLFNFNLALVWSVFIHELFFFHFTEQLKQICAFLKQRVSKVFGTYVLVYYIYICLLYIYYISILHLRI